MTEQETGTATTGGDAGPGVAVGAQLNVYRARLFDAVALGRAGYAAAGASVAESIFQRFEAASGEYGAHETLERTSQSAYEGFEAALGELQSALEDGDVEAAAGAAAEGASKIQVAQQALIGNEPTRALDLLWLASRGANAELLAATGTFEAAGQVATNAYETFEAGLAHDALEDADGESYEAFEAGLEAAATAAGNGDADGVRKHARAVLSAAIDGTYALTDETTAGVAHLAEMQARGYDAAALVSAGGAGDGLAHATTLNTYRARVQDAAWLADAGLTDAGAAIVQNVFAHFEGARAHEALEGADGEAYEGFEGGLESLKSAIESDGDVSGALSTVEENLRTGIAALAGDAAPVLQAGFFRARLADAYERYQQGEAEAGATITSDLFERFEADELGFHETLEETDESLYERFEEEHLTALVEAYENEDGDAIQTHHEGAQSALVDFEATRSATAASSAETSFAVARGFDAAALDSLDAASRATAVVQSTFEHFESGAAGYHEALEDADHETYEAFESDLGTVRSAAESGGDVTAAAQTFNGTAIDGIYAIAGAGGGSNTEPATAIARDIFATFEQARVHEALEEADHEAYEGFEAALNDYAGALGEGEAPVGTFADATLRAQFAVAGALSDAPVESGGEGGTSTETESSLEGGPNVVEGVPDDADHVVSMQAVAFEPAELTVSAGDTVAFEHVAGEAHNVVAREKQLPDGADYWSSGGFDSESAAVEGWEQGKGAVQSGQSYVLTVETTGEHPYYCVPHETAGMEGTIVVEE